MTTARFPDGFTWGAATAAYQIEGAAAADGRGESIWDRFSHTPGKTKNGDTGDIACDHYNRYRDDVKLMRDIGLNAYRFSVSWPRIQPNGSGAPNQAGLDHYSRLVDTLLAAEIKPFVTLYHWDLPQALHDRGGWAERDSAKWFADYAAIVARTLGDRVEHFITLNEPQVFSIFGYLTAEHAPGMIDFMAYGRVCHHVNLAHGAAVQAIRAHAPRAQVGTTLQIPALYPLTDSDDDKVATRRMDGFLNRWYLDPVLLGRYPEDTLELLSILSIPIEQDDLAAIHQPLDFIGLNHYTRMFVKAVDGPGIGAITVDAHRVEGARYTAMGWEIFPQGIYEVLTRLRTDYGNPNVYITENGGAFNDVVEDGHVHDAERSELLQSYLLAVHRVIEEGGNVRGYFVWSLLDNFEWAHGYDKRFGLVHVDYNTQARTLKDSALLYRRIIEDNTVRR